jgi:hypothetical protein
MEATMNRLSVVRFFLAAALAVPMLFAGKAVAEAPVTDVSLTGYVTCAHCVNNQTYHKGYTQFSWALESIYHGDDVVVVVADKTYKLQGDQKLLLKYMTSRVTVTGHLDNGTVVVTNLAPAPKEK